MGRWGGWCCFFSCFLNLYLFIYFILLFYYFIYLILFYFRLGRVGILGTPFTFNRIPLPAVPPNGQGAGPLFAAPRTGQGAGPLLAVPPNGQGAEPLLAVLPTGQRGTARRGSNTLSNVRNCQTWFQHPVQRAELPAVATKPCPTCRTARRNPVQRAELPAVATKPCPTCGTALRISAAGQGAGPLRSSADWAGCGPTSRSSTPCPTCGTA